MKEILGWIVDGKNRTIYFPLTKCQVIFKLLRNITKIFCVSLNKFQELVGKLQNSFFGIPGRRRLFTPLDIAMKKDSEFIIITPSLKQVLTDCRFLVQVMAKNPTSVFQIITKASNYISYINTCGIGAGEVWYSGTTTLHISPGR